MTHLLCTEDEDEAEHPGHSRLPSMMHALLILLPTALCDLHNITPKLPPAEPPRSCHAVTTCRGRCLMPSLLDNRGPSQGRAILISRAGSHTAQVAARGAAALSGGISRAAVCALSLWSTSAVSDASKVQHLHKHEILCSQLAQDLACTSTWDASKRSVKFLAGRNHSNLSPALPHTLWQRLSWQHSCRPRCS
jgi:hypothetical protein